jgi:DNA-binding LacI/PurR family transcriptional regulator
VTRTVTLKSVAQAAGVSPATVSNAFNRPERMTPAVRRRVLDAAERLGYCADPAARSLRTGRTGAVGIVMTVGLSYAFTDPYTVRLLGGVSEVLEAGGTSLVLIPVGHVPPDADVTGTQARESVLAVERAVIDGAIADGIHDDHPAIHAFARRGTALVRSSPGEGRNVVIDDRGGGRAVGEHLAAQGHRDVAVVVAQLTPLGTGPVDEAQLLPYSRDRLDGVREGLGSSVRVRVVSGGPNAGASGRAAASRLLDREDRPTAVVADSDVIALGVLEALAERGLVPGADVAVTGFDDLPEAAVAGLTTVRQPIQEKGRLMARMVLEPDSLPREVTLPSELVVRASSLAATAGVPS